MGGAPSPKLPLGTGTPPFFSNFAILSRSRAELGTAPGVRGIEGDDGRSEVASLTLGVPVGEVSVAYDEEEDVFTDIFNSERVLDVLQAGQRL
ncbi:hypothetical protein H2248_009063 [Termitomyces sp. 'cryptogamus']|nr:hypothetical protein H2248_009063 [Termitomyces sp. 'cryptogamus']